ncbi:alpha/beta fold hydrolase [Nocardia sp. NPDC055029]
MRPLSGVEETVVRPDGTRLRVVEAGVGPDVLLVHGFGVSADSWSTVQPALVASGRRVVAYDQRAHGSSACGLEGVGSEQLRADLFAVADRYDITDGVLVCHSMGNFVALGLLADNAFRSRFRRAVLVSPETGNMTKGAPLAAIQGPMMQLGITQFLVRIPSVGRKLAAAAVGWAASADVVEATRLTLAEVPRAVGPCVTMMAKESVEDDLPNVDLPLHVLTGTDDKATPAWHAELIVARAKNTRIDYIADTGHMLNWEAPEVIVRSVLSEQ